MKNRFFIILLFSLFPLNSLIAQSTSFDLKHLEHTHDMISLSPWGPYSKNYAGISHIPAMQKGICFDFSVMPGYYMGKILVPNV
ncbi:MAG: hypothetical protein PHH93_05095, partial [Prolixibacteraceae bacterium]|nr:hypothetical protein [Prolixibacteraceae bacterium]